MSPAVRRYGALAFALIAYVLAVKPMVYFVGFLANLYVPKTIDGGPVDSPIHALAVDVALIFFFCLTHSTMARPPVKEKIARLVSADLERPLYSAIAGLQFALLIWVWRPLPHVVWSIQGRFGSGALWTLYWTGWAIVVAGVLTLGSSRLYGLETVWARFRGRTPPADELTVRGPYRMIRHPLYSGTLLALWSAPTLSVGRALLAALFTIYILVARRLEERELLAIHGARYASYRQDTGAYLPRGRGYESLPAAIEERGSSDG